MSKQILQFFSFYSCIFQNLYECASCYILVAMVRNCDPSLRFRMSKDIMAPRNSLQYETFLFKNRYHFLRS